MTAGPATLAIDLGGTKTLACLVAGADVLARRKSATPRLRPVEDWIATIAEMTADWAGEYHRAAIAVSGVVANGLWSALNPAVLPVPADYPLVARLRDALGVPVIALNDAQAAAWGEYRYGAGVDARSLVFVTLSTGLGGGLVADGRLVRGRSGLAGSFGQTVFDLESGTRVEDQASGLWIARMAKEAGHDADAADVIARATAGEDWAEDIIARSARKVAGLLANLQLQFDPDRFVIGGGVGLAPAYLTRLHDLVASIPEIRRPILSPAALGPLAGVVGAAAIAVDEFALSERGRVEDETVGTW